MGNKEEKVKVEEKDEIKEVNIDELDPRDALIKEKELLINELQEKVVELSNEVEKVKKAAADITNRNKQIEIDKKYAASDLVKKLLVPMSYFEGALKFKTDDASFNNFLKGFDMIYNLLLDTLKSDGLKEINTNVNDLFNPHLHEVTEVIEVEDGTSEMILEVLQKGFTYKDRVIKPVSVKVSKIKKEIINDQEVDNDNSQNEEIDQEIVN